MMKKGIFLGTAIIGISIAAIYYFSPAKPKLELVDSLIEKNIEARGGEQAWSKVDSLLINGKMDVGNSLLLSYQMEQQRPEKMCVSFEFKNSKNYQCTNGSQGWKSLPFKGHSIAEPLTADEMREFSGTADPFGLLYNYQQRNIKIDYIEAVELNGRLAHKIKINTALGAERMLYLDDDTGLEIKMESSRKLRNKQRVVETWFKDWKESDGLLFATRIENKTEGDAKSHFMTIDKVELNPKFEQSKFIAPRGMSKKMAENS